jgi:hypothetical protein
MNETTTETPGMPPGASPGERMHELIRELEVLGGFRSAAPSGLADKSVAALSDEDALAGLVLAERLGKLADAVRVAFAADIHSRCGVERGDERLSVKLGFATPAKLIATCTGTSIGTASERVKLGTAVHPAPAWGSGIVGASKFPHVQRALDTSELGVDTAEVITRRLGQAAKQIGFTPDLEAAEEHLVQAASQSAGGFGFTANQIDALALNLRDRLDPDGVEPRDKRLNEQRSLKFFPHPSGMLKLIGLFPPEDAASWLAIDAATQSPRIRPSFPTDTESIESTDSTESTDDDVDSADGGVASDRASSGHDDSGDSADADGDAGAATSGAGAGVPVDEVFADSRTPAQKRADVFTDLIRKAATLPDVPRLNGAAATINVHADLDDLTSGRGVGWVPGITESLPATTVEQLLCHADIRTTVFGPGGQVLCQGKKQRLFTAAQVAAMAARDGGCVWPGCDRPPSWCESHHTEPWLSKTHLPGRTDVTNGVLICHFHHGVVHKTGWTLIMIDGAPYFLPPAWLDWTRTPRPATQQRTRTRLKPLRLADLPTRREPWQRNVPVDLDTADVADTQ